MTPETSPVKHAHPPFPAPIPAAIPRPPTATRVTPTKSTTVIESLGVYLPPRTMTTREVLRDCHGIVKMLPLETITGITSRHVAGDKEFSVDLAKQAVARCLAQSRYGPGDIDLLLCANISHCDAPGFRVTIEPSASLLLKHHFGFNQALAFDILNACAGVFTALYVADSLITRGVVERAMIVSGEYITHLTQAAQAVIDGVSDPRIACLTLGDAGIAFILERSPRDEVGFHAIELFTVGRYSSCCVAKLTSRGAWIMNTNYREMAEAAFKPTLDHLGQVVSRTQVHAADRAHFIPHQTSRKTLRRGARVLAEYLPSGSSAPNFIDNLSERGNTATTSHLVALHDHVLNGAIRSGDRVMFAINGSGLTIGSAVYTFDELPDRLRGHPARAARPLTHTPNRRRRMVAPPGPRARIESVGVLPLAAQASGSSLELSCRAAERSLAASAHHRNAIELLLYTGVYRTDFVFEPAIAAMIAGELGINDEGALHNGKRTFAFDVFNSSVGSLNACFLAAQLIEGRKIGAAMVVASEVENATLLGEGRRGISETASALILDQSPGQSGFGGFHFRSFTQYRDALACSVGGEAGVASLALVKDPHLEARYVECIAVAVRELLEMETVKTTDIALVLPPSLLSCGSIDILSEQLKIDRDRFAHVTDPGKDLFTSSLSYALDAVRSRELAKPGDIGLLIAVGAGIDVGCALYYF